MHIHLDAIGGIAGDMFIAAVLDAFPDLRDGTLEAIQAAGLPADVQLSVREHTDHALTGLRFIVDEKQRLNAPGHNHTPFSDIRSMLAAAPLETSVKSTATGIFTRVAEAEAKVHGRSVDTVSFHELGEWDSVADIVGAAFLISRLNARWTVGALPQGSGRVKTAHGYLPVPTPATVLLLEGFDFCDDGVTGERVTPTGAAILNYLEANQPRERKAHRLLRNGSGFGTRNLPGMSNVLRLLAFEAAEAVTETDRVAELAFEIDDQTPEDLAIGLDKLRAYPAVLDVLQAAVFAKKGRIAVQVQVLAEPSDLENVLNLCFAETTTLGIRHQIVERRKLHRRHSAVEAEGRTVRIKVAERPVGSTVKAEADDLSKVKGDRGDRERIRRVVEQVSRAQEEDEA
jgi:uncharacterized protein (TIGR00299 family) protein